MPRPVAFARATNSGSRYLNVNSAMAGTFDRNTSAAEPPGEMWSVEILSPAFSSTGALRRSGTGSASGTSLMLGPRTTSGRSPGPAGGTNPAADASKLAGRTSVGSGGRDRGSVIFPVSADAAATTDEQR